jgi:predicted DNA-binding mobile mystery protein A
VSVRAESMTKGEAGDRVRELDEAVLALKVTRRGVAGVDGWVRAVRRAVGLPVEELARRLGVREREVFRMEDSERAGTLGLAKLKGAAEALGCELVYGLTPKEGTLAGMAAVLEAGREQKRAEARALRLKEAKEKRREAAAKSWRAKQRERKAEEWRMYWEARQVARPGGAMIQAPKKVCETPWWREHMRRELKKRLREAGIRLR